MRFAFRFQVSAQTFTLQIPALASAQRSARKLYVAQQKTEI